MFEFELAQTHLFPGTQNKMHEPHLEALVRPKGSCKETLFFEFSLTSNDKLIHCYMRG